MVKSKSGSKGMVKSVESILPKGISLMHVFLAVVLGLMICSFLSESNNVIEGQEVQEGNKCDKNSKCAKGLKCVNGKGEDITGSNTGFCRTMQYITKLKGKDAAAVAGSKTFKNNSKWNPSSKSLKIQNKAGKCTAINTKLTSDVKYCNSIIAKTKDECEGDHPQCEWLDCSNNASFNDPYLKGKDYDHLIKCLNNGELLNDGNVTWHKDGSKFRIVDKKGSKDTNNHIKDDKVNNSFQKRLNCNVQTDGSLQDCLQYIPKGAYDKIQDASKACYQGWSKYKDAYKWNGNTPILSYSKKDGLKCKNPFYDTTEIHVSDPRLVYSNDCPKGECPCDSGADVVYRSRNDWLKDNIGRPLEDWTIGNRCNVKTYRDGVDGWRCAPTHLSTIMKDYGKVFINKSADILSSSNDSCAP